MATSPRPRAYSTGQFIANGNGDSVPQESLSTVVAEMAARMKDVDPTEEGFSLYEHLNPEAVDALYEHAKHREDASWRLEFEVGDESIIVGSNGFINVIRNGDG